MGAAINLAIAAEAPALPAGGTASAQGKINPTNRVLRFIVPITDGPTYLGDVDLAVATDDTLSVRAPRLLQMLEPVLKPDVFKRLKDAVGTRLEIDEALLASEKMQLRYDNAKLALSIAIPVAARRQRSLSLRTESGSGSTTLQPERFSAYVNLRSAMEFVERGANRGVLPPVSLIDGAVRLGGLVGETETYVSTRHGDPAIRRTGSRLVYDDLRDTVRITVGDLLPTSRSFQSAPSVGGIGVARFFNVLDPQREVRSSGSQSFTLFAPSVVETLVNGRSVERKTLQPGSYTLQDFPLAEGANDVRLRIEDEAGKQRTIDFNLYSNRALIEPGITEFAAFAGVHSFPSRRGIHYSRDWASAGFIRRGLSSQVSAGANFAGDARAQQAGLEMLFGTPIGLVGFDLASSLRRSGGGGFGGAVSYDRTVATEAGSRSQSLHAVVEYRSARFATPGALVPREPTQLRASAGYSYTFGVDKFVSADLQYRRDRVLRESRYDVRLTGGWRLSEATSAIAEAEWSRGSDRRGGAIRFGLRHRFGPRAYGRVEGDSRGTVRASFQDSGGRGVGAWSSDVDVTRDRRQTSLNANASYIANRADLGVGQVVTYDSVDGRLSDARTSLRVGTSIAFAGGVIAVGRPITDGFILANAHKSLGGKSVRLDPYEKSDTAHSGALGAAVDGQLSAYSHRTLIYDVPDAPTGYDLGQGNVQLDPPYRAGYRLTVGSDYHLMLVGRLLDRNGEPVSLLAGEAQDLGAPKRPPMTIFTGRNGKFGAQGLRPGKWRITMPTEPATIYELTVRDSATGTVQAGDLRPLAVDRGI